MNLLKSLSSILFLLLFSSSSLFANVQKDTKIDPMLNLVHEQAAGANREQDADLLRDGVSPLQARVETIIRFKGNLDGVESLGGRIESVLGEIASVDLPVDLLRSLSRLSG